MPTLNWIGKEKVQTHHLDVPFRVLEPVYYFSIDTPDSTAQHSTAQHSTAQHSTAQHSTAQHSTAQHSTAQHSTAQHKKL